VGRSTGDAIITATLAKKRVRRAPGGISTFGGSGFMAKSSAISVYLTAVTIAGAINFTPALGAPAKVFTAKVTSLEEAAQQGAQIFGSDNFGGKQMFKGQPPTCALCHSNNGKTEGVMPDGTHLPSLVGVAAAFPKFIPQTQEVITLEEQLMHCISGGLQGTPPAYNSPQMVDLIAYLTWLSKGFVVGKQF
jgi:thiosulfate dehydrogenase